LIETGNLHTTGNVGTVYGNYIAAITTTGSVSNRFGEYQAGADDLNYFAGKTGFGISAPANIIHIYETTSGAGALQVTNSTTGYTASDGLLVGLDADEKALVWNYENTDMILATNNTPYLTISASGDVSIDGSFALSAGSDNSSTGTINDVTTAGLSYFRFTGAGAVVVTGFANGSDGKDLEIINRTGNTVTLNNQDAGSSAANRIITGTGGNLVIANDAGARLKYDATTTRWQVMAT
jgi:hypothetical protein